jgi:hypothetical protein
MAAASPDGGRAAVTSGSSTAVQQCRSSDGRRAERRRAADGDLRDCASSSSFPGHWRHKSVASSTSGGGREVDSAPPPWIA